MEAGVPDAVLDEIVEAAVKAPSSHNTQPWRFEPTEHGVNLLVDRSRALPVNDPDDRELTMSCGTAVFNLEVAARHFGFTPTVVLLPNAGDDSLIAHVELAPSAGADEWDLYAAIDERHTTRGEFDGDAVPDDLAGRLSAVVALHDVTLRVVHDSERELLAQLVVLGDHWQFADPAWRRELAAWMHPRRTGDGIAVPEIVGRVTQAVVRRLDMGDSTGRRDRALVESAPFIGVLTTDRDDRRTWLEVGRALEHLLLVAALDGLQAGFVNQPVQVPFLRSKLRSRLAEDQFPQVIVRMGHPAGRLRDSARRSLDDVLDD